MTRCLPSLLINLIIQVFVRKQPCSKAVQKGPDARRDEGYAAPRTGVRKQATRRATTQMGLFQRPLGDILARCLPFTITAAREPLI